MSKADAFVVSCIDPRTTRSAAEIMAELGRTDRYSEMRIPGAALALTEPSLPEGQVLLEALDASRRLHGIRTVIFLNHRDCGAVGLWSGRELQAGSLEETRIHARLLHCAAEVVRARHPDLEVRLKLMDLQGRMQALPCPNCTPTALRGEVGNRTRLSTAGVRRQVAAELRASSDASGRVGRAEFVRAVSLYRSLFDRPLDEAEAAERVATILSSQGLSPRAEGWPPFRSLRWYRRVAPGRH